MHVSDALISTPVAIGTGTMAIALIALATRKVKELTRPDIVPLMGVMGAFVFAAQMINFSIPGTGSSGHIIGGVLLSAILGPWAAFITLASVLIVQCLVFADGGVLALGVNIINMGATSCLLAYPLIYKPIARNSLSPIRLSLASVLACIVALETGAFLVTVETEFSGITALPFATFLSFMMPIHVAIGAVEGILTAALLIFVAKYRPTMLAPQEYAEKSSIKFRKNPIMWTFIVMTIVMAAGFTVLASENPDGLEWSIENIAGMENFSSEAPATAIMPEYESPFSGIVGAAIVVTLLWGLSSLIFARLKKSPARQ